MALLSLNISLRFCIDFCLFVEPPSLHGISLLVFLCWSPLARCSRLFSLLMSTDGPAHQRAHSESCRARSSGIGNGVLGVPLSESARARIVQAPSWPRVSEAGLHICNSKKAPRGLLDGPRGIWEPPIWSYRCRSWLWVRRVGRQVRGGAERSLPRIVGGGQDRDWGSPSCHSGNSWVQSDKRLKGSVVSGWSQSHIFPVLPSAMLYLFMCRRARDRDTETEADGGERTLHRIWWCPLLSSVSFSPHRSHLQPLCGVADCAPLWSHAISPQMLICLEHLLRLF